MKACSEPHLQSSTEQWGAYFALSSAAVHWYCITGQLYEEQISIGVFSVAQACSEPHACATENTPMEICSSYSCPVMQYQCTAALLRAK